MTPITIITGKRDITFAQFQQFVKDKFPHIKHWEFEDQFDENSTSAFSRFVARHRKLTRILFITVAQSPSDPENWISWGISWKERKRGGAWVFSREIEGGTLEDVYRQYTWRLFLSLQTPIM